MARVLGDAGRFVSQKAAKEQRRMLIVTLIAIGVLAWISGFLVGSFFHVNLARVSFLINGAALAVLFIFGSWANRQIDALDKKRADLRKGARGEVIVGLILADLPDAFCVINDMTTTFGNIDHVVV